MTAEEVGEVTGQTPGAVRVMAHRGLATLRARLTQPDPDGMGHVDQLRESRVTNGSEHTIDGVQ